MDFIKRIFRSKNISLVIFLFLRKMILPLKTISKSLPDSGEFLEVGCGHGIISYFLSTDKQKRSIIAIDPDKKRISYALNIFDKIPNLTFENKKFSEDDQKIYDVIIFFGVLYLFNDEDLISILKLARKKLKSGGVIYISDLKRDDSLTYKFHVLREKVLKKINFTKGNIIKGRKEDEWFEILNNIGFNNTQKVNAPVFLHSTMDIKAFK